MVDLSGNKYVFMNSMIIDKFHRQKNDLQTVENIEKKD
jgi:hypothetical protein